MAPSYLLTADATVPLNMNLSEKLMFAAWPAFNAINGKSLVAVTVTLSGIFLKSLGLISDSLWDVITCWAEVTMQIQKVMRHTMPGLRYFIGLDFIKSCDYLCSRIYAAVLQAGTDMQYLQVFS